MSTGVAEADADLVTGALAGSERAFQQLVRRYERPVLSVIFRVVRDFSRAEELAQDTFVKAFCRLETYRPERRFATWILAIAHHLAIDEIRRGTIRAEQMPEPDKEGLSATCDDETPYSTTERREFARILNNAIAQLKPEYAELIALKYEQDLTVEEIAQITGVAVGTIKSFLYRARRELAEMLRQRGLSTIR